MKPSTTSFKRREEKRKEFWPGEEDFWTRTTEAGWFRAPRTLPLILQVFNNKVINPHNLNPNNVYLELLSRHIDNGIIEMASENEHAFAAGFTSSRAVRSWEERMAILEEIGFIETIKTSNQKYKCVLLKHPTAVMEKLHSKYDGKDGRKDAGKEFQELWKAFRERQIEVRDPSYNERLKEIKKNQDKKTTPN